MSTPFVEAAAIVPHLELAERRMGTEELGRQYAERFGVLPRSASHLFVQITTGKMARLSLATADQLACFLGLHFECVWPGEAALSERDVRRIEYHRRWKRERKERAS